MQVEIRSTIRFETWPMIKWPCLQSWRVTRPVPAGVPSFFEWSGGWSWGSIDDACALPNQGLTLAARPSRILVRECEDQLPAGVRESPTAIPPSGAPAGTRSPETFHPRKGRLRRLPGRDAYLDGLLETLYEGLALARWPPLNSECIGHAHQFR